MIKLILKICFICTLSFTSVVQAGLIKGTHYITHNYNGVDIDVAWVSNTNTERNYESGINTLYAPDEIGDGWHFAEDDSLSTYLLESFIGGSEDLVKLFTGGSDNDTFLINAFSFWNSLTTEASYTGDLSSNHINSKWVWSVEEDKDFVSLTDKPSSMTDDEWYRSPELWTDEERWKQSQRISTDTPNWGHDTLYFRVNDVQTDNPKPVPEPSTLMIFALGLIALVSKKRLHASALFSG